jgi:hypothetical protein
MLDPRAEVKRLKIDLSYQDVSHWKIIEIENDIINTIDEQTADIISKYFSSVSQYLESLGASEYIPSLHVIESPTKYTIAFESGKTDIFIETQQQQQQDNKITKKKSIFDAMEQINLANKRASRGYKGDKTKVVIQTLKEDSSTGSELREGQRIDLNDYLQTTNMDMEKEIDNMIYETIKTISREIL